MPNITFTRWLQKLTSVRVDKPVTLIHCAHTHTSRLSGHFLRYDTQFTGDRGYFNIDGLQEIILLMFVDCDGTAFTTLRPYTLDKCNYYSSMVGKEFDVVIKEPVTKSPHYAAIFAA